MIDIVSDFLFFAFRISASLCLCGLSLVFLFSVARAQGLPDEFRGYKIYKAKIKLVNQSDDAQPAANADAFIKLGDPQLVDVSLSGIAFEISPEISTLKQSGRVDFLVFKDFRVNGLAVEVEEYREPFEFEKNQTVKFPKPIRISLGFAQAMSGALKEWRESKDFWQVTGRVFIFGRFNKAGFKFKRAVPVDVNLQIRNPFNK